MLNQAFIIPTCESRLNPESHYVYMVGMTGDFHILSFLHFLLLYHGMYYFYKREKPLFLTEI